MAKGHNNLNMYAPNKRVSKYVRQKTARKMMNPLLYLETSTPIPQHSSRNGQISRYKISKNTAELDQYHHQPAGYNRYLKTTSSNNSR